MSNTATRLITLIMLLQRRPNQKAAELANQLGVSVRTIQRYINMLDEMGIPVYSERGPHGGFSLVRGYKMPPLVFTPEEAVAIYQPVAQVVRASEHRHGDGEAWSAFSCPPGRGDRPVPRTRMKAVAKEYIQNATVSVNMATSILGSIFDMEERWCSAAHWFGSGQLMDQKMIGTHTRPTMASSAAARSARRVSSMAECKAM